MIKVINNSETVNLNEASWKYKGFYYLMLISGRGDEGTVGTIQAISDQEGMKELTEMEDKLIEEGKEVLIGAGDDAKMEDLEIVGVKVYG